MGSSSKTQVYGSTYGGASGSTTPSSSSAVGSLLRRAGSASASVGAGSSSRHQARLGVTTDYLDLSLHSACANGNVGLVKYALQHGQPVNSVLNGVLPLHAAASSGNEQIVRMLIAAGADVNSPRSALCLANHALMDHLTDARFPISNRLPRRYSNEKTRSSGIAVGTAGSTPLHFAAANGHAGVIEILLQYGAKPNALEKYDLTPEMIAQQKGHLEAAQLLHEWSEGFEDDTLSINQGKVSSSSSSLRSSLSKKRLHPRRSLDALAVSLQQHASNPHLLLAQRPPNAAASMSLHTIGGQSPISAGGTGEGPKSSGSKMLIANHPIHESHSARRPSLPSVFEKAARPTAALKHALGLGYRGPSDGPSGRVLRKSSSKSNLSASVWGKDPHGDFIEDEEDLCEFGTEADEVENEDVPMRRKSEELTRSHSKRDSMGSLTSISETPATAPPTKTTFAPDHMMGPPAPPPASLSRSGSISTASAASFYRPRHSSQLSGRVVSSTPQSPQSSSSNVQVFIDDEDEATPVNSTLRQRSLTAGSPSSRGPPLVAPAGRRRETSATSSQFSLHTPPQSQIPSGIVTPDSLLTSSRPTSDDGASGSTSSRTRSRGETHVPSSIGSRTTVEPARRGAGFVVRNRTDSASSTASSALSRRHLSTKLAGLNVNESQRRTVPTSPSLAPEPIVKKAETRTSRSNSAGTDGRFSSSPASSYSGPGTLSTYAPSTNSTTATSIATSKSSHNASPVPQYHARLPVLSPLYESSPHSSPSTNNTRTRQHVNSSGHITTSAEARTRVKKVEQELLEFAASGSSASGASTTKNAAGAATAPMSLTDTLAAYGQGLALERRLKAIEKNGGATPSPGASGGFRFETIGTSSSKAAGPTSAVEARDSALPTATTTVSKLTVPVPQWRAIPPVDRLMPPAAAAASGRRSVSPVSGLSHATATHSAAMPAPSRKSSRDSESTLGGITFVPIAASVNAGSGSSTAPPTRASSPSSSRSGKSQTHTLRNAASSSHHQHGHHPHHHHHHSSSHPLTSSGSASIPVQIHQPQAILGMGDKGVSYVEAVVPPSSSPATSHHRSSIPKNEISAGNRSSRGGGSSVTSVQEQVDLDALEQARLAAIVPIAPITRPKEKRRGFANKLFGK
ncbi:BZ3500_MvSof-1268-A1-R1_Chr1-1g01099 [Microbotryum saponariae]|uniref:BZ3500_MvSof-1268-A1-R1_Chr1-1g01099 protein n=1 Tax=Microbotryum saponariae TaxID=289078 RepID=A0A2X0L1A3_9BASI|nr:BZ3500_MvSof-1268-A1-R1_Chr1-1g01099 [Microbotryum saponariae]SCZ93384.1 BZ3501_MvSof-1269-A2-R1_Chr1-1g00696 [Microbotryum saponariae]